MYPCRFVICIFLLCILFVEETAKEQDAAEATKKRLIELSIPVLQAALVVGSHSFSKSRPSRKIIWGPPGTIPVGHYANTLEIGTTAVQP